MTATKSKRRAEQIVGYQSSARSRTDCMPVREDQDPCPGCDKKCFYPDGTCRLCSNQDRIIPIIATEENEQAAIEFIRRPQPVHRKQGRTA